MRWLKWAIPIALLAIATGLWILWDRAAERDLRAVPDRLRAAGEPATWAECLPPPIPDDRNAIDLYRQAYEALQTYPGTMSEEDRALADEGGESMRRSFLPYPDLRRLRTDDFRVHLALTQRTHDLVRQARIKGGAHWGNAISDPLDNMPPLLSKLRNLSRVSGLHAASARDAGDAAASLADARDILAAGRFARMAPHLLGHLIGIGIDGVGIRAIEETLPFVKDSASRTEAKALIADLLNEDMRESWPRAFQGERCLVYQAGLRYRKGELPLWSLTLDFSKWENRLLPPLHRSVLRPAIAGDIVSSVDRYAPMIEAAGRESLPAAQAVLPPEIDADKVLHPFGNSSQRPERAFEIHYRAVAVRRMAAVALAIRLFELDNGRRPETLQALVGKYLPALPIDPMAGDGRSFRRITDSKTTVLASVGLAPQDDWSLQKTDAKVPGYITDGIFHLPTYLNGDRPIEKAPDDLLPTPTSGPAGPGMGPGMGPDMEPMGPGE